MSNSSNVNIHSLTTTTSHEPVAASPTKVGRLGCFNVVQQPSSGIRPLPLIPPRPVSSQNLGPRTFTQLPTATTPPPLPPRPAARTVNNNPTPQSSNTPPPLTPASATSAPPLPKAETVSNNPILQSSNTPPPLPPRHAASAPPLPTAKTVNNNPTEIPATLEKKSSYLSIHRLFKKIFFKKPAEQAGSAKVQDHSLPTKEQMNIDKKLQEVVEKKDNELDQLNKAAYERLNTLKNIKENSAGLSFNPFESTTKSTVSYLLKEGAKIDKAIKNNPNSIKTPELRKTKETIDQIANEIKNNKSYKNCLDIATNAVNKKMEEESKFIDKMTDKLLVSKNCIKSANEFFQTQVQFFDDIKRLTTIEEWENGKGENIHGTLLDCLQQNGSLSQNVKEKVERSLNEIVKTEENFFKKVLGLENNKELPANLMKTINDKSDQEKMKLYLTFFTPENLKPNMEACGKFSKIYQDNNSQLSEAEKKSIELIAQFKKKGGGKIGVDGQVIAGSGDSLMFICIKPLQRPPKFELLARDFGEKAPAASDPDLIKFLEKKMNDKTDKVEYGKELRFKEIMAEIDEKLKK